MILSKKPCYDFINKILKYNYETGELFWRKRDDVPNKWNSKHAGKVAGTINKPNKNKKYKRIIINIGGKMIKAHHIVWLLNTGMWPPRELDHIDRNPLNNRFCNLRLSDRTKQAVNSSKGKNNKSGIIGVSFMSREQKYKAEIGVNGKTIYLGSGSLEKCTILRLKAEKEYFGEFAPQQHLFKKYNI